MNLKSIRNLIVGAGAIILILSLIPFLIYVLNFGNGPISKSLTDWGLFGDYIGGTLGTILAFTAIIFSLISVYISSQLSHDIHDKEKNIIQIQNKPLFYLDLHKFLNKIAIKIQNNGMGPLIITSWKINYKSKDYANFNNLFFHNLHFYDENTKIVYNGAPTHILAPNTDKSLLQVEPSNDENTNYVLTLTGIEEILKESEITINYQDIFSADYTYKIKLDFFG